MVVLVNEPFGYSLIALSVYYLIFTAHTNIISRNAVADIKSENTKWFIRLTDVFLKVFIWVFYAIIFSFACRYYSISNPVSLTETSATSPDTVSPLHRMHALFAWMIVMFFSTMFTHIDLAIMGFNEELEGTHRNPKIYVPLGYDKDEVMALGSDGSGRGSTLEVSNGMGMAILQCVVFAFHISFLCYFQGAWYLGVHRPDTMTNWSIMNISAAAFGVGIFIMRFFLNPRKKGDTADNSFTMTMTYMKRHGDAFRSKMDHMHVLVFLPKWLIHLVLSLTLAALMEIFNDYGRLTFSTVLLVVLPYWQAVSTGSLASWWYFYMMAWTFFLMFYWNVTVTYPPFNVDQLKTGVIPDTAAHRYFYWMWDWANTNLTYDDAQTKLARYFFGATSLYFAAVGGAEYMMERAYARNVKMEYPMVDLD